MISTHDPGLDPSLSPAEFDKLITAVAGDRARLEAENIIALTRRLRLASFRTYLATTLSSMSSLVPLVLAAENLELDDVIRRLRPVSGWPHGRVRGRTHRTVSNYRRRPEPLPLRRLQSRALWAGLEPRIQGSAMLHDGDQETAGVGFVVVDQSLEVSIEAEMFALRTELGLARVQIDRLPDAIALACIGRSLDDVIEHPILTGRGFVVADVVQPEEDGQPSVIEIDVGARGIRMPMFGSLGHH